MGWNVKINKVESVSGSFIKTKVLADYPVVFIHTARTGERPGYQNKGTDDYIKGDFVGLDKDNAIAFKEMGSLWSFTKNQKTGEPNQLFQKLRESGLYIGSLEKKQTKDGSPFWAFNDLSEEMLSKHEAVVNQVIEMMQSEGTSEGSETASAASNSRPW